VAIITAALTSAQFLAKTIANVKDAPSILKDISADVRAVESVLQNLDRALQDDSSQIIFSEQIRRAVENCDRACKAFQSQIERWMKDSKGDQLFWVYKWKIGLFGQERIRTFRRQLSDCKGTLNVALSTATMFVCYR
jgi:hypothetical protein